MEHLIALLIGVSFAMSIKTYNNILKPNKSTAHYPKGYGLEVKTSSFILEGIVLYKSSGEYNG